MSAISESQIQEQLSFVADDRNSLELVGNYARFWLPEFAEEIRRLRARIDSWKEEEDLWHEHDVARIVNEIFHFQNLEDPETDPGDITIQVQDDSRMVTVQQGEMLTVGEGITHALSNHLARVTAKKVSSEE